MKAQQLMFNEKIDSIGMFAHSKSTFAAPVMANKSHLPKIAVAGVILAHLVLVAVAITHTKQYRPMDIINPAEQSSIQVTMIDVPPPPPKPTPIVTEVPKVLTSDQSEREVKQVDTAPPPPEPKVETSPPVAPPKIQPPPKVVPKVKPRIEKPRPIAKEKPSPIQNAKVADKVAILATSQGKMLKSAPNATPKNVSTVGCQVPAPDYPRRAKRLQEEGEVLIRVLINSNGSLGHSEIARSSGYDDLDQAAVDAVSRIKCNPYIEDGQAISVMTIQPITFKLAR
ncbi:TPA: energy transducer TonB [Klebsiella michiganensis]|nr:energy transducer TonB [Klebsiella michiganensis]